MKSILPQTFSIPITEQQKSKLGISSGGTVSYNFKKSYGLRTGIDIHMLNYTYDSEKDSSKDELMFLSVPLTGRLYPVNRIKIELGIIYNFLLSAKGDPPTNKKREQYHIPQALSTIVLECLLQFIILSGNDSVYQPNINFKKTTQTPSNEKPIILTAFYWEYIILF